jgi:hypothetical protein
MLGRTVMRLASAEALPVRPSREAKAIRRWLDRLVASHPGLGDEDLEALRQALRSYGDHAARLEAEVETELAQGPAGLRRGAEAGDRLLQSLKAFVDVKDPSFYRHPVYGWDIHALYGGDTLPGLARALRAGDEAAVARERQRLVEAVARARGPL